MNERNARNRIFLDVTPSRTPYPRSANVVVPMKDNLMDPLISKDIVYENIKPVFTLLRVMGVLPLTRPSARVNQFVLISPSMFYSVIVCASLVTFIVYLSLHKVQILKNTEGKFEEAVIEYLFTVYLFPALLIPILWYETRKIAGVLNSWVEFEVRMI